MKLKPPKTLDKYSDADEAAAILHAFADRNIAGRGGKVRWTIQVHYWNDDWLDESKPKPEFITRGGTFANK